MLFDFVHNFIIDSSQYRETLAVHFPVPPKRHSNEIINGRPGILYKKDDLSYEYDPDDKDWLTPEPPLKEDFDNGVEDSIMIILINRASIVPSHMHLDYKYVIYMSKNFLSAELVAWDLTLIETPGKPWKVCIGLSGLNFGTTIILPGYNFI